jgi:hypothetical protein
MTSHLRRELIDHLMDAYIDWREECITLGDAYERWLTVAVAERSLAFAAYRAALDREQQASSVYTDRFEMVSRKLAPRPRLLRWLERGGSVRQHAARSRPRPEPVPQAQPHKPPM